MGSAGRAAILTKPCVCRRSMCLGKCNPIASDRTYQENPSMLYGCADAKVRELGQAASNAALRAASASLLKPTV